MDNKWFLGALAILALVIGAVPVHGANLDSTLFTNYTMDTARTNVTWYVCGSLPGTSGCYGAGFLGPFGKVGAMLEGLPTQNLTKGTVTRYIYVLDESYASGINGVALFVYKKVDTIAGGSDAITVTLFKTVILPLTGGQFDSFVHGCQSQIFAFGNKSGRLRCSIKEKHICHFTIRRDLGSGYG